MKIRFPAFENARVLILGDVMLDRYWHGPTSRISPEAPVPVVKVEQIEDRPGGAGNVALNIASLGGKARLLGLTGADEAAAALVERLGAAGVACDFETVDGKPTILKLRVLSRHQQLIRLDFEDSFHLDAGAGLSRRFESGLAGQGAVILSDYAKGALNRAPELIASARQAGVPVLVDPKGKEFARYAGATLITPNLSEFEAVVGHCATEAELVERGHRLIAQHGWEALLVTRGEQGMSLLKPGMPELHLPALAREVYDVTGAGDTVIATLAAALAAGDDMASSVALANIAAGIVVGKLGTATVSAPELRRALAGHDETGMGVVSEEQLLIAVAEAKAAGERIVMTNGCFDILHAGHVSYLETARKQGDRLIVAVNTDASVSRLKGPGRPINAVDRRMQVLAALGAVDWVVPFAEDTPARLIGAVLPDVLVKGGDYKPEQIAGAEAVWAAGGEVRVLQFVEGESTTAIINTIKSRQ
ncbi:MAG: bifunctional D-glycero-beta-D-manno-heptose-7-phosphate kinase/D-glycero-beta-D-manno-heptose 1-phosphate adenylyltransferase HldE [Gammaproteobacteria bacterium]|nr:bifunctional D-glycero-beta-D-manno-heptose-7-phosphate kinase/D-glycero-beta-D-manno-heptose 1-phosphate adenylyltransferase HldE [Gammaproteobacteria bacterium]